MRALILANKVSLFLLGFSFAVFSVGGSIAIFFKLDFIAVLFFSVVVFLMSIPVSVYCLFLARRIGIVGRGYVFFSLLFSFIIWMGWIIVPFMLRRDIVDWEKGAN